MVAATCFEVFTVIRFFFRRSIVYLTLLYDPFPAKSVEKLPGVRFCLYPVSGQGCTHFGPCGGVGVRSGGSHLKAPPTVRGKCGDFDCPPKLATLRSVNTHGARPLGFSDPLRETSGASPATSPPRLARAGRLPMRSLFSRLRWGLETPVRRAKYPPAGKVRPRRRREIQPGRGIPGAWKAEAGDEFIRGRRSPC